MVEENRMTINFLSKSENVPFSRVVVGAFVTQVDPNLEQIADIKTAVSEAVTNSVVHAYGDIEGEIEITCSLLNGLIEIIIEDFGKGIKDIKKARQPFYSSCNNNERSGMGFTLMEMFSDNLEVKSEVGKGTKVIIKKSLDRVFGDI